MNKLHKEGKIGSDMKTIRLSTAYVIGYVLGGGLCFVIGLFGFFTMTRTSLTIETGMVIAAWICILFAMIWKKEKSDEMSEKHLHKAFFYGGLMFLVCLVGIDFLGKVTSISIMDNFHLFYLAGGFAALIIGLYYLHQERRG